MELVGPEAKVSTGYSATRSALISVPSFWLMKNGASIPRARRADANAATTSRAIAASEAFMMAAFSRSMIPIRPIRLDSVTAICGASCAMICAARSSIAALTGENSPQIAAHVSPSAFIWRAASATARSSSGELIRPS